METFINGNGSLCCVVKRSHTVALIAMPFNKITPFVVPIHHVQGSTAWGGGMYYADFDDAYSAFIKRCLAFGYKPIDDKGEVKSLYDE